VLQNFLLQQDAVTSTFKTDNLALLCYQSVYWGLDQSESHSWHISRRFTCQSYEKMHQCLLRHDIPLRWKNLYEVLLDTKARNLYFDLEQVRPPEMPIAEHDTFCWRKVLLLQDIILSTFRFASLNLVLNIKAHHMHCSSARFVSTSICIQDHISRPTSVTCVLHCQRLRPENYNHLQPASIVYKQVVRSSNCKARYPHVCQQTNNAGVPGRSGIASKLEHPARHCRYVSVWTNTAVSYPLFCQSA
jgi:hypothetical protein